MPALMPTLAPVSSSLNSEAARLRVSTLDIPSLRSPEAQPLAEEWQHLFDRTLRCSHTQHPDRVQLAAEIDARNEDPADYLLAGKLLTCRDDSSGELVGTGALIPKRIAFGTLLDRLLRRPLRGYYLAAGTFLGAESEEILPALLEGITRELAERHTEFVVFENVEHESPLWNKLHELTREGYILHRPQGVQPRLRIRFPEVPDDYWKQFSSKTRNTFRRKQKHLGATELRKFTRPEQVPEFLALAHTVSLNTWQTRQLGLRIENNEREKAFLTWEAEAGIFRSYVLMRDNRPLAFLIGNQYRGWFNYEEVGYDCEFSNSSPGTVLLLQVFEELLHNDPPDVFDFGAGDADYKRLFANWTSSSGDIWLVSRKFAPQAAVRCLQASCHVRRWGKTLLAQAGVWTKVRQFLRTRKPKSETPASSTTGQS